MDPRKETEDLEVLANDVDTDDSDSVDDFIRQLEEKEKDLHITVDTTIIEIEQGFDDGNPSVFLQDKPETETGPESVAESADLPFVPDLEESDDAPVVSHAIYNLEEQVDDLEEQVAALKQTIARMEDERAELFKTSQRRAKDFEAYKTRTERERSDTKNSQVGNLAAQLLPAIDNLDRAFNFADHLSEERSSEFEQFFEGILMVKRQLAEIFIGMGIEPIEAVGQEFDPYLHEAVAADATEEFTPNTICEEMLRGYRIGDHIIRHSMVKVATAVSEASSKERVADETDSSRSPESVDTDIINNETSDPSYGGHNASNDRSKD